MFLTKRQREIYEYIVRTIETTGRQPTIREMAMQFNITSPNGIMCHLQALERKGWVRRTNSGHAGLILLKTKFIGQTVGT